MLVHRTWCMGGWDLSTVIFVVFLVEAVLVFFFKFLCKEVTDASIFGALPNMYS
jgi:hypothetical protein